MANITCLVRASIWYSCELDSVDSAKVKEYMKLNNCDYAMAVSNLYDLHEIGLYDCSVESDFCTEEIEQAECDEDEDDEVYIDEDEDVW